jgi:hypothetical protein
MHGTRFTGIEKVTDRNTRLVSWVRIVRLRLHKLLIMVQYNVSVFTEFVVFRFAHSS